MGSPFLGTAEQTKEIEQKGDKLTKMLETGGGTIHISQILESFFQIELRGNQIFKMIPWTTHNCWDKWCRQVL